MRAEKKSSSSVFFKEEGVRHLLRINLSCGTSAKGIQFPIYHFCILKMQFWFSFVIFSEKKVELRALLCIFLILFKE